MSKSTHEQVCVGDSKALSKDTGLAQIESEQPHPNPNSSTYVLLRLETSLKIFKLPFSSKNGNNSTI